MAWPPPARAIGQRWSHRYRCERNPQLLERQTNGAFELHRIGDAVTTRNVYGATYDALRPGSIYRLSSRVLADSDAVVPPRAGTPPVPLRCDVPVPALRQMPRYATSR